MAQFSWSAHNDVFLPEIDAEHRALFTAGRELHRAVSAGACPDQLEQSLRNVALLAEAHFTHEERLMADSRFQSCEWHCKQHDTLRRRVAAADPRDGESIAELLNFMAGWLEDHIAVADRMMASHLRNWMRRRAA